MHGRGIRTNARCGDTSASHLFPRSLPRFAYSFSELWHRRQRNVIFPEPVGFVMWHSTFAPSGPATSCGLMSTLEVYFPSCLQHSEFTIIIQGASRLTIHRLVFSMSTGTVYQASASARMHVAMVRIILHPSHWFTGLSSFYWVAALAINSWVFIVT